jgi:integrase
LNAGTLKLEGKDTKSGKARIVPLNQDARGALQSRARYRAEHCPDSLQVFCRKSGAGVASVKTGWTKVLRKAGLEDFHFHDLRHTAATRLADAGTNTREIMAILGHRCIQTSARYTHATDEGLRRAMEALAQRQTRTDTKVPTIAKQRQVPAA